MSSERMELPQGTLDLLILKAVRTYTMNRSAQRPTLPVQLAGVNEIQVLNRCEITACEWLLESVAPR